MSVCDKHGQQLNPDEWGASPSPIRWADAMRLARSVAADERLPEAERLRLVWAALDAADEQVG